MKKSGFTLIQLSIILTVASLVFVATLPGIQTSLQASATSTTKMNSILNTMRGYMAANGNLPCPADPTQAIGASNYGVAAANSGATNNCTGGTPAAAYADTTKNIAIGMVPVKTLGLSYADALDGYGRDITYAVDTNATGNANGAPCWASTSLTGAITVADNGTNYNTVAVLVSHGADGYGAWLPLSGTSGTASRLDNGSTDTAQADNAQVAHGGGLTANSTFASFVRKSTTSTFDDSVVYKSNLYTLNNLPTSAQVYPTVTPPSNGTYSTGNVLTFTLTYASNVSVTGTPRLDLSALGSGTIGTGNVAYATYQSGSGTTTLTFSYTVQVADSAPTSGLTMNAYIDLNGGNISGGSTCFTAPSLTGVLIASTYYRTVTIDHTKVGTVGNTDQTSFPVLFSGTYSYLATAANLPGTGQVLNANGYDITFTSDAAGHNLLPFERESWNATTGASVFWVQVPTVSHTADTVIYLQYGNSAITTDQSNKTGTWDSNYKGVWHLDEASGTTNADSTSNGLNATKTSATHPNPATGQIAGGQQYNNVSGSPPTDYDTASDNAALDFGANQNFTVSAWVKSSQAAASGKWPFIVSKEDGAGTRQGYSLLLHNGLQQSGHWHLQIYVGGSDWEVYGSSDIADGNWHYIVGKRSGSTTYSNQDGAAANSLAASSGSVSKVDVLEFGTQSGGNQNNGNYIGTVDEVRISNVARSDDWIKTEYNNQNSPSTFYTVGAQTSR